MVEKYIDYKRTGESLTQKDIVLLGEAWRTYTSLRSTSYEPCCKGSHQYMNRDKNMWVYKTDENVCKRERAWRKYVRIRDNNPEFPFNNPELP